MNIIESPFDKWYVVKDIDSYLEFTPKKEYKYLGSFVVMKDCDTVQLTYNRLAGKGRGRSRDILL